MLKHWYVYLVIAAIAELLLLVCNKYEIIKSKTLRTFIVIAVSTFISWCIYDFVIASE